MKMRKNIINTANTFIISHRFDVTERRYFNNSVCAPSIWCVASSTLASILNQNFNINLLLQNRSNISDPFSVLLERINILRRDNIALQEQVEQDQLQLHQQNLQAAEILEKTVRHLSTGNDNLMVEMVDLKKEIFNLKEHINRLNEDPSELQKDNDILKQKVNHLQEENNTLKEQVNHLQEENNTLKEQVNHLQEEKNTLKQ